MIIKNKKVYYCEYCKKHSLAAGSLSVHEKHCLKNIDRECRLCKIANSIPTSKESKMIIIEKIKSQMRNPSETLEIGNTIKAEQPTIQEIKNLMSKQGWEGCPNCLMSVLILSGITNFPFFIDYNYKKELDSFWRQINVR